MARTSDSKIWSTKAKKRTERNRKAPNDVDSVLLRTRTAILRNQQQLALTLFDLIENVETILKLQDDHRHQSNSLANTAGKGLFEGALDNSTVESFLGEMGIFPRDIRVIQRLSKALDKQQDLLVARSVSLDTIKALAFTTEQARLEALTRVGAGAKLAPPHIKQIEREFKQAGLTDEEKQLLSYNKELERAAQKLAREQSWLGKSAQRG